MTWLTETEASLREETEHQSTLAEKRAQLERVKVGHSYTDQQKLCGHARLMLGQIFDH